MATENKRQSMSGKGPSGPMSNVGPSGTVALEAALSGAIGARIRITTAPPTPATLEGSLFAACPITNLIAINTSPAPPTPITAGTQALSQPSDFHIIPVSRIQNFQLLSLPSISTPTSSPPDSSSSSSAAPSFTDAYPSIYPLDISALKSREAAAVARAKERESRRGKGVSKEAQDLFDAFSRTMPVRWDGTSIVVADTVVISKPYRVDDCKAIIAEDGVGIGLPRVRKVLEMERKKIELRNASAAIANAPNFAHPHGHSADTTATPPHSKTTSSATPRERDPKTASVAVPIPNNAVRSPAPTGSPNTNQRKGG